MAVPDVAGGGIAWRAGSRERAPDARDRRELRAEAGGPGGGGGRWLVIVS